MFWWCDRQYFFPFFDEIKSLIVHRRARLRNLTFITYQVYYESMTSFYRINKLIIIILMLSLCSVCLNAQATLSLSVNPAEGGNTLRLGRVDGAMEVNKAVKLRITTNDGKQY